MIRRTTPKPLVICVSNKGYRASLELGKLYELIPDAEAKARGMVRVVDESGKDYLYPAEWFVRLSLPAEKSRVVAAAIKARG